MKILHATCGSLAGNSYELGSSTVIGRDGEADIQLLEDGVSRRHACVIENEDGGYSILDLGSSNGTKVNGELVTALRLKSRAKIEIGDTTFLFGEVDPEQVDTDNMDMRLTTGPALDTTVMGDAPDALVEFRAAHAAAQAAKTCCDSPLAVQARTQGWAHCPACGQPTT